MMARIRTIKPEFWEDEKLVTLPLGCRLFYIGTWNFADDLGVLRYNPVLLKSRIFPLDESLEVTEIENWVELLIKNGMMIPFEYNGIKYIHIRTFKDHQRIDKRYGKPLINESELKPLLDYNIYRPVITDKPQKQTSKKANTYFIKPTIEEIESYCKERNNGINTNNFFDFYESKGWMVGKNKVKDWKACVRTWESRNKQQPTSTKEKLCKWSCDKIGLSREGTYEQFQSDVKRNAPLEVKFLGYVE
jgi:hypothetical protein